MQNLKQKNVPMGEYLLVRDMFVADTMEEVKEKAGEHMVSAMRWVVIGGAWETIWTLVNFLLPKVS